MGTLLLLLLGPIVLVLGLLLLVWCIAMMIRAGFRILINKLLSLLGTVPPTP